jgi:hypothetical protein
MRIIKFRGKSIDTQNWVFGNLIWDGERAFIVNRHQNNLHHNWEVFPESVGQFTGLYSNWKDDIWESDRVKILYTDWPSKPASDPRTLDQYLDDISIPGEVVFYNGSFCIEVENTKFGGKDYLDMNPGPHGFIKVIGSIHDQPVEKIKK